MRCGRCCAASGAAAHCRPAVRRARAAAARCSRCAARSRSRVAAMAAATGAGRDRGARRRRVARPSAAWRCCCPALAFASLLLCAAARLLRPTATLRAGAVSCGGAGRPAHWRCSAARSRQTTAQPGCMPALAQQLAMLVSGTAIGLLTRRAINRAVRRARAEREQRFAGLLAWPPTGTGSPTPSSATPTSRSRRARRRTSAAGAPGHGAPWEIADFGLDDDAHGRAPLPTSTAHRPFHDLRAVARRAAPAARVVAVSGEPRFDERGVFVGYWGVARDITDEVRRAAPRRASETRYRELFARSPSPLVLHRDGGVLDANAAALALFGCLRAEATLIGQRPARRVYDGADGSRERAAERLAAAGDRAGRPRPRRRSEFRDAHRRPAAVWRCRRPACRVERRGRPGDAVDLSSTTPSAARPRRRCAAPRRCCRTWWPPART